MALFTAFWVALGRSALFRAKKISRPGSAASSSSRAICAGASSRAASRTQSRKFAGQHRSSGRAANKVRRPAPGIPRVNFSMGVNSCMGSTSFFELTVDNFDVFLKFERQIIKFVPKGHVQLSTVTCQFSIILARAASHTPSDNSHRPPCRAWRRQAFSPGAPDRGPRGRCGPGGPGRTRQPAPPPR